MLTDRFSPRDLTIYTCHVQSGVFFQLAKFQMAEDQVEVHRQRLDLFKPHGRRHLPRHWGMMTDVRFCRYM